MTELGIVLNLRRSGGKDRSQSAEAYFEAVQHLVRESAWGYLQDLQTLEIAYKDGYLKLVREPWQVVIEWKSRLPRRTPGELSLGLWLRACVAGWAPAGQL